MLPIPGTSSLAHLDENMAAEKLLLSPDVWKKIEDLARKS
jgi:aryl-alcohol dehydrogenase-like predicted oxidoreductase